MRTRIQLLLALVVTACTDGTVPSEEPAPAVGNPGGNPGGNGPPPGDPFDPDRVAHVTREARGVYATTNNGGRRTLVAGAANVEILDYKLTRQHVAAHVRDGNTGTDQVVVTSVAEPEDNRVAPDGVTEIADLGFSHDGGFVFFTGVHQGARALFMYEMLAASHLAARVFSDVLFGAWATVAGIVVRQGQDVYLVGWDYTIIKVSTAGDPDAFPRLTTDRRGRNLLYSKGDELYHVDVEEYVQDGVLSPLLVSRDGGAGDIRGDLVEIADRRFVLYTRDSGTRILYQVDLEDPDTAAEVPGGDGVVSFGGARRADAFWFKTGPGQLWSGTIFGPTFPVIDTGLVESPAFSADGAFLGFAASAGLSGPFVFHVALPGGGLITLPDLDGPLAWTFGKGSLPGAPAGTPLFWGAEENGDRTIRSGTVTAGAGQPEFSIGATWDVDDSLRITRLRFRYDRWDGGDPTDAVVAETTFQGFNFLALGLDAQGARFPSMPLGFEADVNIMGFTTGDQLAPVITTSVLGVQLYLRGSYLGFGPKWDGASYEKNIAVMIDEDGIMRWYEWSDGALAILQTADGQWTVTTTGAGWVLTENGFPGRYEGEVAAAPPPQTADQFVRAWMDRGSIPSSIFFPDSADKTTGFDLALVLRAGLVLDDGD